MVSGSSINSIHLRNKKNIVFLPPLPSFWFRYCERFTLMEVIKWYIVRGKSYWLFLHVAWYRSSMNGMCPWQTDGGPNCRPTFRRYNVCAYNILHFVATVRTWVGEEGGLYIQYCKSIYMYIESETFHKPSVWFNDVFPRWNNMKVDGKMWILCGSVDFRVGSILFW